MAKKWVNAGFKSRGEAIEYVVYKGHVKGKDGSIVYCDADFDIRTLKFNFRVCLKDEFWEAFETMEIEVDEPEHYEIGKLYEFSDNEHFNLCMYRVLDCLNGDKFVDSHGLQWKYCREIPAELLGKIK